MRTGIALGANLGDRLKSLRGAVSALRKLHTKRQPFLISRVYETEPVDCAVGDPTFLNAVVEIDITLEPLALLDALQAMERKAGRPVQHPFNSPRALDLDLLYMDSLVLNDPRLTLPHPLLARRRFVLAPLCDVRPSFQLPGWTVSADKLLLTLPASPRVTSFPATL